MSVILPHASDVNKASPVPAPFGVPLKDSLVEEGIEQANTQTSEIRDAIDVAVSAISAANSSVGEALAWIDEAGLDFEDVSQILVSLETVQVELECSEEALGRILANLD
jgi:hypothetical protein